MLLSPDVCGCGEVEVVVKVLGIRSIMSWLFPEGWRRDQMIEPEKTQLKLSDWLLRRW